MKLETGNATSAFADALATFIGNYTMTNETKKKSSAKTKKKSRNHNALVHGLYAKDVLLPWDSKEDFERLHEDLKAEYRPHERTEEEAVLDLTFLHWDKQTLRRMWQSAVLKDPFTWDIVQTGRKSWSGIRKQLRGGAKDARSLQVMTEENFSKLQSDVERLRRKIEQSSDREEIKVLETKMGACLRLISEHVAPLLQTLMQGPNAEKAFDNVYSPESMEKIVRLEAAIDARIAKVMGRLRALKEFKRTPAGGAAVQMLEVNPRT